MFNGHTWFSFVIAILATWRITHLLAKEDGPAYIIARIRALLGDGLLGQLMDCFKCLSMWVALPITLLLFQPWHNWHNWMDCFLGWFAISGAACLLEQLGQQSVIIQPIPQMTEGDHNNGLLWTETTVSQQIGSNNIESDNSVSG
ncbi:MAG: hypothetical protein ACKVZH_07940 [Blastocatellia bacterium]